METKEGVFWKMLLKSNSLLTLMVIALSAFPFFTTGYIFNVVGFVFLLILFLIKRLRFDVKFLLFLLFITFILLGQAVVFDFFSIRSTLGIYVSLLKSYFAIKIIGKDIIGYFVSWMVVLTLVSFVFFLPSLSFPSIELYLIENIAPFFERTGSRYGYSYNSNILIYTLNTGITKGIDLDLYLLSGRNPGPFHEPGGFVVYLLPALVINTLKERRIVTKYNIVLILGILSTFSTTGYIGLGIFVFLYLGLIRRSWSGLIIVPLIVVLFFQLFNSIGFLGDKIEQRTSNVNLNSAKNAQNRERYANFLVDMNDAVNYPLTGRGVNENTRYDNFDGFDGTTHKNNGLSDLAARYGIVYFLVFFYLLHRSLYLMLSLNNVYVVGSALFLLLIIMLVGFSQVIFNSMFFISLMLFSLTIGFKRYALFED